jgi:hypothetical protein
VIGKIFGETVNKILIHPEGHFARLRNLKVIYDGNDKDPSNFATLVMFVFIIPNAFGWG